MSNTNDKQPPLGKESSNKNDAQKDAAENMSMFDSIKQYFSGKSGETPAPSDSPVEKAVDENGQVVNGANAETNKELQGAPNNNGEPEEAAKKPEAEDGKPKELTLEDIEKLQAAAAGEAQESGFSVPETIQHNNRGGVDSLPRDLGLNPFPPLEQKILPTVLSEQQIIDNPVQILDLTPKLEGGDAIVNENDLLANRGPNESEGSDPVKESTTVAGDFKLVAPDGVDDLTVGGNNVITNGVFAPIAFVTPLGNVLSITGYNPATGVVTYEYTLVDNEQHPNGDGTNSIFEDFDVHLSDTDGDTADGTLSINIVDDIPSIEVSEELVSLIVDESFLAVDDTASFAGLFNAIPGADGASVVYELNIIAPGADSGIVDTFTNDPVLLFKDGNDIVGRVGNIDVFRISIDPNNGDVTLNQLRSVVHADPNDANDIVSLAANNLISISATITDADGDVASATRDIGNAFQFRDDAPSIEVSLTNREPDQLVVDETDLSMNATADFSDNFIVNSNFGADGPGSIVTNYQLQIPADGTDSGLIDVATQESVLLYLNGGVVEGRTSGSNDLVFTVSVNGTGIVTLDQIRALDHPNPNNPDDPVTLDSANFIQLKREDTITDKDGDTQTDDAILDIGKALIFKDDGPQIDVGLSGEPIDLMEVDETNLMVNATANFADNFSIISSSYGADGAGSITNSYTLSVNNGSDSGLVDVATGQSVLLFMNGNVVEGRTSGSNAVVFTVSVDNLGNVTLDQIRALQHADPNNPDDSVTLIEADLVKLTLTATITDKDGDSAQDSQTLNIGQALSFKDDGPNIDVELANVAPDALVVDETNLNVNASANFADNFVVNSNYGADGAGTIVSQYTLSISAPGANSGLIDVATGQAVLLSMNGGVVEGRTSGSNTLVFTVSVNGAGVVTLDQIRALQHPNPANPDDSVTLADANLIKLTRTDTITDKDGDQDSDAATLSIGQAISFKDDGPCIDVKLAAVPIDKLIVDETDLNVNASANFADNFVVNSNYGADGAGTIVSQYTLSISAPGANSGLIDVATGQTVLLSMNGGVVEGRTSGSNALVFTVSVNGAGVVTLDQIRALQHPNPANPDDSVTLADANLIKLTRTDTITDKDGDQDSDAATLNIGKALSFEDDGPNIDVELANVAPDALVVDETNLNVNASANFADNFVVNSNYGADGAGTIVSQYTLSISAPGANSGLIDVATGQTVLLSMNGGVVEGRTSGSNALVFTVSVNGAGVVTLDQIRALQHPNPANPDDSVTLADANLIKLTRTDTITDRDGDQDIDSATLNIGQAISFKDDGPSIHVTLATVPADALVVDESNFNVNAVANFADNFNVISNFGADGAGTITSSYGLAIKSVGADSGLDDTLTNQDVLLFLNGGVVEGRTAIGNELVFTVSVDAFGNVTLDGIRSVEHPNQNDHNDAVSLSADLIKLIRSDIIVDKDGDSAQSAATLNIGQALTFRDDGPNIDANQVPAPILVVDESNFLIDSSASFAGLFTSSFGADGPKDVDNNDIADADAITYSLNVLAPGADSGLDDTLTGQNVVLTLEAGQVVGRAGLNGPVVFTISVDANSGEITLNQSRSVVHANQNDPNDSTMFSANNLVKLTATIRDGDLDSDSATRDIGQAFRFQDDGPIAVKDGCFDVPLPVQPKYNLTFVLDISGSMDSVVSGQKTRLDILKEALTNPGALLDSYQAASSDLRITIVTFNSSAQTSIEFSDVAAAKAFIDGLDANGTTNYLAAANAATADVNADDANAALVGFTDRLYWLSDGEPVPDSTALTDAQELAWRNNLIQGNVEAYMLNIGGNNANIVENLADLDDDQPGTVITVAPDLSNLQQILIDTINQSEVQGNVLANDIAGADQNPAVVNVYFFLADNAAANAYIAAHPELVGATASGNKVTIPVPNADITTPLGNILHIEADGDFTYTTVQNNNPNQGDHDDMFYTMRDGDGDRASAEFCFIVDLGVVITNLTPKAQGGDVTVDEDDLLSNRGVNESAGSDTTKESTTQPGSFNISAPNGVDDLSVGGNAVITNGVFTAISFTTPLGNTLSITAYNPATGEISYTYTLNDNEQHPNANGQNALFEDFNVLLTDVDGDSANAILTARVIDDVPDAINDTNASIASENNTQLLGNVRTNDIQGADGATVTPVNLNGTYGNIVINADGSYVYTLNVNDADFKALGGGGVGVENFNYTLTDADGDSDVAKLTLNIKNDDNTVLITDLTPKAQGGDVTVDEDDLLASRGPGESAGSDPTKESTTQPGDFKVSAPDGIASLTVGGNNVIVNGVFTATSFSTPLGNTLSITGYNAATGVISYEYTLKDNENHPNANGENAIFEDFAVTLTDTDGDTANDTLSARIIDDVPTAVEDCFTIPIPVQPKYNLTFVLDISGSMDSIVSGSKTRLDILKEALTNSGALLDSYQAASSELKITFITFNSAAQTSMEFSDIAAAKAFINSLDANGTTNYQAAANAATADVNADDANAALVGFTDRLYWLSDGEPVPDSTALTDAQELAWRNNLIQGNVEAYMLNIGGNNADIVENLADLDDDQPGVVITVAPDLSNLQQILVDTINQTEVLGNVLANDVLGADNNASVVNIYFNLASAQAANAYIAAHPELIGATVNGAVVTIPVPNADITTPLGNILHIEADGDFKYTSNVSNGVNGDEDILFYTMKDNDGDQSSAEFCFDIDFGVTITNLTPKAQGGDVVVDEDDLLANRGPGESAGSDTSKESTTQAGNFNISAPNGVATVTIGGQPVITNGVFTAISFTTPLGNTLNITGYNPANGLLTYLYTLNDNEQHPNANGQNSLFEDFNIVVTDIDGDSANAVLTAGITDDVPDAIDDTNASVGTENNLVLTGNVRTNDIQGADGASVTPVILNGTYGTIDIKADGSYTYTINPNDADFIALAGKPAGSENFNYTLTDADGDSDTAKLTLNIRNDDDGVTITDLTPKAQGGDASVNENDLLASRGAGESAGSDPVKESTTTTGNFKISAPDGIGNLSVGGHDVIVNNVFTATSFSTPLGNTLSITGFNAATGVVSYSYTLNDNENHPNGNGTNSLFEDFNVSLRDIDGDSTSNTLSINIIDDVPTAVEDCFTIPIATQPKYNLTFVLDISGSMDSIISGSKTRLDLLKEALTNNGALLDSYQAASTELKMTFVTFNSGAQTSIEFSDVAAAKAFINGLDANGTTNYLAAANAATADVNADDANAALVGFTDRLYWLSDGEPNPTSTALTDAQELAWRNNLIQGNVEAYMLNIGGTNANIVENLADLDDDQPGTVITVAPDLSNLQQILVSTITQSEVQGNVLANDIVGADGNPLVVNIYFSLNSAQEANAYISAHPELVGASVNGNTVTIPIPNADITTPAGNILHIEADGDFKYTSNSNNNVSEDVVYYTMKDNDGDTSQAEFCFEIDLGVTITNLTPKAQGGDVSVDEDDLLASRGVGESAGSDTSKESTTQAGNFNISAPNGVDDVTIDGHSVITNGVFSAISFSTPLGNTLAVTGYDAATGLISYTYTLNDNEMHPNGNGENSIFEDFNVVVSDIDGDTANGILSARIVDDVPSITILPVGTPANLVVDETNLAINSSASYANNFNVSSAVYGADGAGSQSSAYSLSLSASGANSGLVDVATGQVVNLFMNGSVVEGRISGGTVVFTISVSAAGVVTLDQIRALKHPNSSNPDDSVTLSSTDLIKLTRTDTIIDADGDSASSAAVINIGQALSFKDDGPSYLNINDPDHDSVVEVSAFNPASGTTHSVQLADWSYGADSFGSLPTMTSSSGSGNVIFNAISSTQVQYKFYEGSSLVATLTLNANGTDSLELANRPPLLQEDTLLTSEAKAGGPGVYFVESSINPVLTIRITGNDNDGKAEPTSDDQVNPSTQGWAVDNNIIEVNESIKFESLNENTLAPISIFNFSFMANGFTGGQSSFDIKVKVTYSNSTTETFTLNVTSGQVVSVKDLSGFNAGSLINAVEVFNNDNSPGGSVGFRLNGVKIVAQSSEPPPDLDYNFSLKIVDKDGDSAIQNFSLHLDGDAPTGLPGYAVDGPIVSATIFQDSNVNAVADGNEATAISGDDGSYHLMAVDTNLDGSYNFLDGRLVSVGGTDSETGLSYDIPLFAPVGSSVISPLTSILQMQLEKKAASEDIMAKLNQALGIAPQTDLTHVNPLIQAESGNTIALMQAAAIMTLTVQLSDALTHILKVPATEVADDVYLAIGNSILNLPDQATADFKNVTLIDNVITELNQSFGLTHHELDPIAEVLQMSQAALQASLQVTSDPVEAISAVQTLTQGQVTDLISSYYNGEISAQVLNQASHDVLAASQQSQPAAHQDEGYSVTAYDNIQVSDEKVAQVSLHTNNAEEYIKENGLDKLHAQADEDGKTVHIPVPQDGSEIEFATPMGGSLALNNLGEYAYSVHSNAQNQAEHFSCTLLDSRTGNLHNMDLDVSVLDHPGSLISLMGSDANDIMSSANINAEAIMMEGGKGINDFIIDVGDTNAPETIFIKDLGINKQNVLSFVNVEDANHDGKVSFMDAVESFHQDGPNANLEITLQNKTTLVLENVGTVPGHDMQALQQHLESITAELHVIK